MDSESGRKTPIQSLKQHPSEALGRTVTAQGLQSGQVTDRSAALLVLARAWSYCAHACASLLLPRSLPASRRRSCNTVLRTALCCAQIFPGIDVHFTTLVMHFRCPLVRDYILLHGMLDCSRDTLKRVLTGCVLLRGSAFSLAQTAVVGLCERHLAHHQCLVSPDLFVPPFAVHQCLHPGA